MFGRMVCHAALCYMLHLGVVVCQMRINALACMDHLLESLDKMLILDDVLPFLTDITCQDPDVVVAVVS